MAILLPEDYKVARTEEVDIFPRSQYPIVNLSKIPSAP